MIGNYATPLPLASGGSTGVASSLSFTGTAAAALSSGICVYAAPTGVDRADKGTISQSDKILGVTTTSTSAAGQDITIMGEGKITDPSFSFTPGPIWLGNSGALTQVKPTSGLLIQIATALSATEIYVDIGIGIALA